MLVSFLTFSIIVLFDGQRRVDKWLFAPLGLVLLRLGAADFEPEPKHIGRDQNKIFFRFTFLKNITNLQIHHEYETQSGKVFAPAMRAGSFKSNFLPKLKKSGNFFVILKQKLQIFPLKHQIFPP